MAVGWVLEPIPCECWGRVHVVKFGWVNNYMLVFYAQGSARLTQQCAMINLHHVRDLGYKDEGISVSCSYTTLAHTFSDSRPNRNLILKKDISHTANGYFLTFMVEYQLLWKPVLLNSVIYRMSLLKVMKKLLLSCKFWYVFSRLQSMI